jgi:DNA-binding transcriptional LysR family regulator
MISEYRCLIGGGGRISLTPGGEALLTYAEKLKAIGEEAISAVAEAYGQHAGELSIGASQTIAQYVLPRLLAGFRKCHPQVSVTARSGNSDAMLEALLSREIQLALIEGPEQRRDLHIEAFMEDHMVLVVPAGHEWAGRELAPEDLCRERLLMREFGSGSSRVVEQAFSSAGLKPKRAFHRNGDRFYRGTFECSGSWSRCDLRFQMGSAQPTRIEHTQAGQSSRGSASA